ncbi:MAG: phosphoribosylaminoimidazolesuccinocarboxamide synthase [Proteobacteria bacterium]|nr:phosphoribosylaminoimidazolesuccinocarboxamide synthase [Pseudomonadota bacterium]
MITSAAPTSPEALFESNLPSLQKICGGKVRDLYAIDDQHMLIVTSDRLSAFDVVLPDPIPGKGRALTAMSNFWFNKTRHIIPNHIADLTLNEVLPDPVERSQVEGRAIVVKKLQALPIEAVVRGYLIGSGWQDYQATGAVCGIELAAGLRLAGRLPEPIYTPATKADVGDHDKNISYRATVELLGEDIAAQARDTALALYRFAAEYALQRGIIIADTKFEFGLDDDNRMVLIDEALTPDSSRFWPAESYRAGISPPSFDKQFVRDYLETLDWDKTSPGPSLPADIVRRSSEKYAEALSRLIAD